MKAAIIGTGVMGQVLAFNLLQAGWQVTLFDQRASADALNCSQTAAGLLTPMSELEKNAAIIFQLGVISLKKCWPTLLQQLPEPVYFADKGSLVLAHPNDKAELQRFQHHIETRLELMPNSTHVQQSVIRQLEPELAQFQEGLYLSAEGNLDNQQFLTILQQFLLDRSVKFCYNETVIPTADWGKTQGFQWVFDCRGLGAQQDLPGLRGIRGEVIWLHAPEVNVQRPIRLMHPRHSIYIAPRPNHLYIVGASEIETEDNSPISVQSTLELLSAAYYLHKGFAEARVLKTLTHSRPTFEDHLPKIFYRPGLIALNGLYRHGFLLAPVLAQEILRYLTQDFSSLHFPNLWQTF
ncbi:MAG: FAD-dependent oxidoreductase [Gammaproteobacteria bacterium]